MEKITVFAVAYAGGSARATFSKWALHMGESAEVVPLEYAGHGNRMTEPFHNSIDEIVDDMMGTIRPIIEQESPYVFYGHSMGCAVVYEVVRRIAKEKYAPPEALYLSARRPPNVLPTTDYHSLTDEEFLDEIKGIGGTPEKFFENKFLIDAFLPVLRNDYKIIEQYRMKEPVHVTSANIHFFLSDSDSMISKSSAAEWENFTSGDFEIYNFPGGHFFINDFYPEISRLMSSSFSEINENAFA